MTEKCTYKTPNDLPGCERECIQDGMCLFHLPKNHPEKPNVDEYHELLCGLVMANDTTWIGFIFPEHVLLSEFLFDSIVDLRWSIFEDVSIDNIVCNDKFDMRHSIVNGIFHVLNATFNKGADFYDSKFLKTSYFHAEFIGRAGFHGCEFYDRTSFLGSFCGTASFNGTLFHEAVTFRGGRDVNITVSPDTGGSSKSTTSETNNNSILSNIKKGWLNNRESYLNRLDNEYVSIRRLFKSEIIMTDVEFRRPESTKFIGVDMSKVSLRGTDVKGVHFIDVNFYQPDLKRQGLYDELLYSNDTDNNLRSYMMPQIESEYRNVRVAMEENKNFSVATDFYIGEMEARLQQKPMLKRYLFSIEVIYKSLSKFGSSPFRAIRIFLLLTLLHSVLVMSFVIDPSTSYRNVLNDDRSNPLINEPIKTSFIYIANSTKVLTLQRGDDILKVDSLAGHIVNVIFRVLGPIQIALIILAIRIKIKRY